MSGKLFKGEAAAVINDVMRQYIHSLFHHWKLVKAADVSSVGGLKTLTTNAVRNVVDKNGTGYFPSPTTVNQSRVLLDHYGMEVGYHHEDKEYGEEHYHAALTFFVNQKRTVSNIQQCKK